MTEVTFTFRVDDALKSEFSCAAKQQDRSGAQLLRDYMRDVIRKQQENAEHDVWFRGQVQIGLNAANASDVLTSKEVEAAAWREATRNRMAGGQA